MEIQGSINQLLTLAAAGVHLNPTVQKLAKQRDIEHSMTGLKRQLASARSSTEIETPAVAAERLRISEEMVDLSRERLRLDPTEENWARHTRNVRLDEAEPGRRLINTAQAAQREAEEALMAEQARLRAGNVIVRPSGIILPQSSFWNNSNTAFR